jgi:CRP-like cAMP-binding protein
MRIGLGAMRAFLRHGNRLDRWQARWEEIAFLRMTWLFGERIALIEQDRLVQALQPVQIAAGAPIASLAGSLCLVRRGALEVSYSPQIVEAVVAGGFINEHTVLGRDGPAWQARASEDSTIAWIAGEALRRLPVVMWKMLESNDRRRCAFELGVSRARKG